MLVSFSVVLTNPPKNLCYNTMFRLTVSIICSRKQPSAALIIQYRGNIKFSLRRINGAAAKSRTTKSKENCFHKFFCIATAWISWRAGVKTTRRFTTQRRIIREGLLYPNAAAMNILGKSSANASPKPRNNSLCVHPFNAPVMGLPKSLRGADISCFCPPGVLWTALLIKCAHSDTDSRLFLTDSLSMPVSPGPFSI